MIFGRIMPSAAAAEMSATVNELAQDGAGLGEILEMTAELTEEHGPQIAKESAIPSAIGGLIATALAAFLINVLNKQEPNDNRFGPYSGA